jgi:hypothetical protein
VLDQIYAIRLMQYRNMNKPVKFSDWVEQKQRLTSDADELDDDANNDIDRSVFSSIFSFQDDIANQLEGLQENLPEAGPLSAAFRTRIKHSLYFLLGAVFFATMTVLVGLPTILLKPTKFVTCTTMTSLCVIGAIAVMQKPSVFVASIFKSGIVGALPFISLLFSLFGTIYIVVFRRSYLWTVISFAFQLVCILWFLSSFIPGGSRGLQIILKAAYVLISTTLTPLVFLCKKSCGMFISRLFS